jgi:isoleucyl-tRNA synthetase
MRLWLDAVTAQALKEVSDKVEFVEGTKGKERFLSFLGTRNEWCCSRQR